MNIRRWLLPLLALAASTAACGGGAATIESKGGADAGPTCGEGTVDCGGTCVSTSNDPKNCGACGTTCKDGEVCSSGACGSGCAGSQASCDGKCVDTMADLKNCGGCGKACKDGEVCSSGKCSLTCAQGTQACGGICVDVQKDRTNCGKCATSCKDGEVCSSGKCAVTCQPGLDNCSGVCANLKSDVANCGKCGTACDAGQVCSNGTCAVSCQKGLDLCNGTCVNQQSDIDNCGGCANACEPGQVCSAGKCAASCQKGLDLCDGACTDLQKDVANCGACGTACKAGEVCSSGTCALSCQDGLTNCSGVCSDLNKDVTNCGACDTKCDAGQVCSGGACKLSCQNGLTDCNGACTDVQKDNDNCGACGTACSAGQVCKAGACTLSCQAGLSNCSEVCADLQKDPTNCGACGTACKAGEVCSAGSCALSCQQGLDNCSGFCTDLQKDNTNCGGCGTACKAGEVCNAGKCGLTCQQGLDNCSGKCVDLQLDGVNCGACGTTCPAGQLCSGGKCSATCNKPLSACNNSCVDTRFDPDNCGGCGVVCAGVANGSRACNQGKCIIGGCNAGFFDCDGKVATGCEISLTDDEANCGGCNIKCGAGQLCCNSTCGDAMKNNNSCGACGNVCGANLACCGGNCIDPKFQNVATLDCAKIINGLEVQGPQFSGGTIDQLTQDGNGITTVPAGQNPLPAQSPYVWIAAHDSAQVHKVDAKTGAVVLTVSSRGVHPSRGAVALDGSFWIANRGDTDPNNPAVSNVAQILPDGTSGCTVTKAADGQPLPFCRALAIDANGYVWLGTWNDARLHKIDPATCKVVADYAMNVTLNGVAHTSYPYGLAVDRNGLMWNSNIGTGTSWLGMDTSSTDPTKNKFVKAVPIAGRTTYGVAIDQQNNVYYATWGTAFGGIWRVDATTLAVTQINGGAATNTRGLTLDVTGDLYATEWTTPGCIAKFKGGTGAYLGRFCSNSLNYTVGIAGDTYGKIWATGYNSNNVIRFKPDFTVDGGFPVALPGVTYYNYSDWNGMILKTVTSNNAQAGTWTKIFDSGSVNTQWATATWVAVTPPKTSVAVYFKAGNTIADFANQKTCGPFYTSPVDLTACAYGKKQLMQVIVNLNTTDVNVQPSMSDLQVFYQ